MKIRNRQEFVTWLKAELGLDFAPATQVWWNLEKTETHVTKVLRASYECNGKFYNIDLYYCRGSVQHTWYIMCSPEDKPICYRRDNDEIYRFTHHTVINNKYHNSQLEQLLHELRLAIVELSSKS